MSHISVAVVDYEMGNIGSVVNAFEALGARAFLAKDQNLFADATHVVLPGVGSYGEGMEHLINLKLIDMLEEEVLRKNKPFLGICLGMQLLADEGYEFGHHKGLGWIHGSVRKLEAGSLVLPHVGWNNIHFKPGNALLNHLLLDADFYFVHSYCFHAANLNEVIATCDYGENFVAIVGRDKIFGAQFHPEKSQKAGKVLLENFLNIR